MCNRFSITINKVEKNLEIKMKRDFQVDMLSFLAQLSVNTLQISGESDPASLNPFLDAFVTSNLCTIQELDISELEYDVQELFGEKYSFRHISKVAEIQSIKKLKCSLSDTTGTEKLGQLNNLEELVISAKGSLDFLFIKLAEKNTIRRISCKNFDPKYVVHVSRIRSLEKLMCLSPTNLNLQSCIDLANSSIEELYLDSESHCVQELLSAFSSNRTTNLKQLHVFKFDISQMAEVKELTCLKRLLVEYFSSECGPTFNKFPQLEYLAINKLYNCQSNVAINTLNDLTLHSLPLTLQKLNLNLYIGFRECKYFVELKKLEALECSFRDELGLEILANMQSLKKLTINAAKGSLSELFRAFALKSNLQELHAWSHLCSDDIREISKIKSLTNLSIWYQIKCDNLTDLGELFELKSLHINRRYWGRVDIESVLPIFKSCQKLQCAELKGEAVATNLASRINQILKPIRDPALQGPLKLCIIEYSPFPVNHEFLNT